MIIYKNFSEIRNDATNYLKLLHKQKQISGVSDNKQKDSSKKCFFYGINFATSGTVLFHHQDNFLEMLWKEWISVGSKNYLPAKYGETCQPRVPKIVISAIGNNI